MNHKSQTKKGFTLLELLIVIAILAVLGAMVIFLLNPAETLRKARDSQRISDLGTIKTALGLYLTNVASPDLDGTGNCTTNFWSSAGTSTSNYLYTSEASSSLVDGNGWIPVNLSVLTGGSPISNFPVDPVNTTGTDQIYRYGCSTSPIGFEVDAKLESTELASSTVKDGGNNSSRYESGTKLNILTN